jgi:hypothetical protein
VRCVERSDGDVDPVRTPVAAVVCRAVQHTENAKTYKNLLCRDFRNIGFCKKTCKNLLLQNLLVPALLGRRGYRANW